jgi:hypothetical protein
VGKVTVKHYLEKKVNPILIYGDTLAYPVYVRITVNRKTTQLKSITEALMSEKAFEHYKGTGEIYNYKSQIMNTTNHFLSLKEEPNLIQSCIETLAVRHKDFDFSNRSIREQLTSFLTNTMEIFIKLGHKRDWEQYYNLDMSDFLLTFNPQKSIIHSVKSFKSIINIDLREFLPSEFLKEWQIIEIIKCLEIKKMPFIQFYHENYMQMFLEASQNEDVRKYCLIEYKYPITQQDIHITINRIIEAFFAFLPK